MEESKMKVKVIGRDWKQTIKDILDEYLEATKEFDGEYEEVEIDIDDGKYIIISDSDEIYKKDRDELELLVWRELNDEDEEEPSEIEAFEEGYVAVSKAGGAVKPSIYKNKEFLKSIGKNV